LPHFSRTVTIVALAAVQAAYGQSLRPPAVPLVACDPYFSIWSRGDKLTDVATTHWTGAAQPLTSLVRIDGKPFRLMGAEPASIPALKQTNLQVLPTRSIYTFKYQGITLNLTFMTPSLPDDMEVLSRPVTYLTWDVKSTDGAKHDVKLYFDTSALPTVDQPTQKVKWDMAKSGKLLLLKFAGTEQRVLGKTGDDRRIDWGTLYSAATYSQIEASLFATGAAETFAKTGSYRTTSDGSGGLAANVAPVAATIFDLGSVGSTNVSRHITLAYDDEYSIQYFGRNLRPYWRRKGMDGPKLLAVSEASYDSLKARCEAFDRELMADMTKVGGKKYALLAALAYRQCFAGNKIAADANGQPIVFPKENTSNGCIGTVDIIFPMSPQFLLFGPSLTKAMIVSNLDYASSPRWKWPFAPHDLGTYPKANGQVYGGGERTEDDQMPVEETGNMLIIAAGLAKMEGNANFSAKYWPTLTRWARFLASKGFDPENQLSTDDFMGHLAHNTNLSVKAALGLASYGYLCDVRGLHQEGKKYRDLAKGFADRWAKEALDGDHYRLAFDKEGSWSQKYNLVWDKILGFNIFSAKVKQTEVAYYRKVANPYGVALDSRQDGTPAKIDWSLWSATLTGNKADFDAIVGGVFRYVNESPERVGMGDLYNTKTGHFIGMHSRPVVGAFMLPFLYDKALWQKWAARDTTKAKNWAPLPVAPVVKIVVPTSEQGGVTYSYTTTKPAGGWLAFDFDASSWLTGPGALGTPGTPGITTRTRWDTPDIWVRRDFNLDALPTAPWQLYLIHDEDAEVYLNGVLIANEGGYTSTFESLPFKNSLLRKGRNVIAIKVHQTGGGQGVDFGMVEVKK